MFLWLKNLTTKGIRMKNVISINVKNTERFSKEIPEDCTLLQLAKNRPVKVFEIESIETGSTLVIAHFTEKGITYIYHDGDTILTAHLFFYLFSYDEVGDSKTPEQRVISFFDYNVILCD